MNLTLFAPATTDTRLRDAAATLTTLRITTPWYRPLLVEADPFGTYNVQFSATSDEAGTRVHIAAFPEATKKKPEIGDRPVCALSGTFETQQEAIEAWENGFVVLALDDVRPPHLARAIVKYLLKHRLAEAVEV